jgi:hypothetical protein
MVLDINASVLLIGEDPHGSNIPAGSQFPSEISRIAI